MDDHRARRLLAQQRQRVEREIGRVHLSDDRENLSEEELQLGLAEQLGEELAAIERAERRLALGTYGRSIESGAAIPDARLELVPWAERTVEEQARIER